MGKNEQTPSPPRKVWDPREHLPIAHHKGKVAWALLSASEHIQEGMPSQLPSYLPLPRFLRNEHTQALS